MIICRKEVSAVQSVTVSVRLGYEPESLLCKYRPRGLDESILLATGCPGRLGSDKE
jgi:hypothetical protein